MPDKHELFSEFSIWDWFECQCQSSIEFKKLIMTAVRVNDSLIFHCIVGGIHGDSFDVVIAAPIGKHLCELKAIDDTIKL